MSNGDIANSRIRHFRYVRWGVICLTLLLVLVYNLVVRDWLPVSPEYQWEILGSVLIIVLGGLFWLVYERAYREWKDLLVELNHKLDEERERSQEAQRRLSIVFQTSELFFSAKDENEIVDLLLKLSVEVTDASGASFVSLDHWDRPLPARTFGKMPMPDKAWLEYLATPNVRQQCRSCQDAGQLKNSCPLLVEACSSEMGIYCLDVGRGGREFGMLNLYLPHPQTIDEDTSNFLRKMIKEAACSIESIRLHQRERDTLQQLHLLHKRMDRRSILEETLYNVSATLDVDLGQIIVFGEQRGQREIVITYGDVNLIDHQTLANMHNELRVTAEPVFIGDLRGASNRHASIRSYVACPVQLSQGPVLGAIVLASKNAHHLTNRQLALVETIANQLALVLHNLNLVAELEYRSMMEERTRLAREIHDGLAQTLGFLKLKMAQIRNFIQRGKFDNLEAAIEESYLVLADAYQDARMAIDGLRIDAGDHGLEGWLRQTVTEFEENSGLPVTICEPFDPVDLPPEVHAQLIRIVQEALNNVRKHAGASHAWISCRAFDRDLILEVRDDGRGFRPENISRQTQRGLQSMRERAELIGSDFQVTSRPGRGTMIRLRLPVAVGVSER